MHNQEEEEEEEESETREMMAGAVMRRDTHTPNQQHVIQRRRGSGGVRGGAPCSPGIVCVAGSSSWEWGESGLVMGDGRCCCFVALFFSYGAPPFVNGRVWVGAGCKCQPTKPPKKKKP